jgi:hypothetical protein
LVVTMSGSCRRSGVVGLPSYCGAWVLSGGFAFHEASGHLVGSIGDLLDVSFVHFLHLVYHFRVVFQHLHLFIQTH